MEEPQRLGDRLHAARLAKGVSLEEAAAATRIRRSALQSLENDDFDTLPAAVYTRGFLLNYARYLGLIPEEILEEFDRQQRSGTEFSIAAPQDEPGRQSSIFSSKLLWTIVLVIALGVILNFVYQEFLSAGPAPVALENETEAAPTSTEKPSIELPPLVTPSPVSSPSPSPSPTPITGVNLTIRSTNQEVWIQVTVDAIIVFVGIIGPETDQGTDPLTWNAEEGIGILFGRTGGVEISVNERDLAPLVESEDPVLFEAVETEDGEIEFTVRINGTPVQYSP